MKHVTLRQLRVFTAVARHLSYSAAARALHLTQPAVSMQVRQLEEQAGLPLFERAGRRIQLTGAGRELLRTAGAVSDLMREADESLQALKGVAGGELHIGVVSTAKYFAPKLLAEFRRLHPRVTLRLTVSNREAMVRGLDENTVDLVIMGRAPRGLDTVAVPFARHPLAVVAAPEHPLAGQRRVPLSRLKDETFIIRESGSGTRAAMEHVFSECGFRPRETLEMSSNETIKQAVMAGMGISFISRHTVGLELAAGKLVVLDVVGLPIIRDWYVIHLQDKRLAPIPVAFRAFLLEHGARILHQAVGDVPVRRSR